MAISLGLAGGLAYMALRDLGCLRPGQLFSADMGSDILFAANQMIDAWELNTHYVPWKRMDLYTLTAGTQVYTIGPNETVSRVVEGNTTQPIQTTRPTYIETANIVLNTFSPPVRQPMEILRDDNAWMAIRVRSIPFAIPLKLYYDKSYDPTNAFGVIWLWPGPQSSYQLELMTWQQIPNFANLSTTYIFPPGYQRLIQKQLAVEIAPLARMYAKIHRGESELRDYDPAMLARVDQQARSARADIERYNAPTIDVKVDPAFVSGGRRKGTFNFGDGYSGRGR